MTEAYRFVSAEYLLCETCRVQNPIERNIRILLVDRPANYQADLVKSSKKEFHDSLTLAKDVEERLDVYRSLAYRAYVSDTSGLDKLDTFLQRYSRVINDDLQMPLPHYYWFKQALPKNSNLELRLFYFDLIFKALNESTNCVTNTITVPKFTSANDNECLNQVMPFTHKAKTLAEENLRRFRNPIEPVSTPITPFQQFFIDYHNSDETTFIPDQDFIWYLQRIEHDRKNGIENSTYIDQATLTWMGLVIRCAWKFYDFHYYGKSAEDTVVLDLIQEGYLMLRDVFAKSYDWRFNVSVPTVVTRSIMTGMRRYYYKNYVRVLNVPSKREDQVYQVKRLLEKEGIYDFTESNTDIIVNLLVKNGWKEKTARNLIAQHPTIDREYIFLDKRRVAESDRVEVIVHNYESLEEIASYDFLREALDKFFDTSGDPNLVVRNKQMLAMKLGLYDGNSYSLEEIGSLFGMTRQAVHKAIKGLYGDLKESLLALGYIEPVD